MVRLSVGGKYLVLPPDLRGTLILKSPLLFRQQEGSLSFPFTISALEPVNQEVLGFPQLLGSLSRVFETAAVLEIGPARFEGILRITRVSTKQIECSLAIPPGNIPAALWDKKLTAFDLGTVVYPTETLPTNFYAANDLEDLSLYKYDLLISLRNGNRTLKSVTYNWGTPNYQFYNPVSSPFWADFASEVNTAELAGIKAYGNKTNFSIYTETAGDWKLYIEKVGDFVGQGAIEVKLTKRTLESFQFYQHASVDTFPLAEDERYFFPVIKSPSWYSKDDNPDWKGYVNNTYGDGIRFNSQTAFNSNSLAPAIYLKWLIKEICTKVGYRFFDDFFDGDLAKLMLWTNQTIDRAAPDIPIPKINVYQKEWKIAGQLPDWTLEEFSDQLFSLFATRLYFDSNTRIARLVSMERVLSQILVSNYDDRIFQDIDIELTEEKPMQLAFQLDSSDAYAKEPDLTVKDYKTLFTRYPLKMETEDDIELLQTKITPMDQFHKVVPFSTPPNRRMEAMIDQAGISPLYTDEKKSKDSARIGFKSYKLLMTNIEDQNTLQPGFTLDSQEGNYKLEWNGYQGLYQKFWYRYFLYLKDTFSVKLPTALSENDLASWEWYDIKQIGGLKYLPAQLEVSFTLSGMSPVAKITWQKV
ncbi:hypothetical protein BWI96_16675 [Siphonobacter sp. SORGH_AS_0500]|uniref:hypothetical protein n=1 Tax=Siphonobacter sp. SORGH_AS_0500 TaxID=1864824 RepID=UPI000CC1C479|nr:hypothetical protein [Siphonobacter sp. SORGH_AS_0500]PKK35533.1 hypothetical protein BWI96_16675 [Siphonobacter sp. SORGH_AS_0500]